MSVLFSPTTCRFYLQGRVTDDDPIDLVEITAAQHLALVNGQAGGLWLAADVDGNPILIEPPPPSPESLAAIERVWRDGLLSDTDGIVSRHRDELEEGPETTLTAAQYAELQVYRRQLRDWPQGDEFPLADHRPVAPSWFTENL